MYFKICRFNFFLFSITILIIFNDEKLHAYIKKLKKNKILFNNHFLE